MMIDCGPAIERRSQPLGKEFFSYSIRAFEEKSMGQPIGGQRPLNKPLGPLLAQNS